MEQRAAITIDEELKKYPVEKFNRLIPTETIQQISPFHKPVLEIVQLSIEAGDFYEPVLGSGNFAPHATALQKIAFAAGAIWNARNCKRTDNGGDPNIISYMMEAAVRKNDGTYMVLNSEYMLDLTVIEEELKVSYEKKAKDLLKENKLKKDGEQEYINKNVRRDLLQKRKFRLQIAQTGAMDRVIRKILGLKGTYKREEIAKPFVVPRITFQPDVTDPAIRSLLLKQGFDATNILFGPPDAPMLEHRPEVIEATVCDPGKPEATEPTEKSPIEVIEALMKRKGYTKLLPKPLTEYSERALEKFKEGLEAMADAKTEAKTEPEDDDIPL